VSGSGGNLTVTTTAGNVTVSGQVSVGSGTVTINPVGTIYLNHTGSAVVVTAAGTVTFSDPVVLNANTAIDTGTGVAGDVCSGTR
jgi:lipopolysaccharide export system protein LptA